MGDGRDARVTLQVQAIGEDIEEQIRKGVWAAETQFADRLVTLAGVRP